MASIFDLFKKIETEKAKAPVGPCEYIVAGLGNPGAEYIKTRHNAGFSAIDFICRDMGVECVDLKFKALTAKADICGKKVLLMKPQTFMNNSGESLREAADFYKIPPEKITVLYDDINFEPGTLRIREKGSDGGHNGMKSIIYHLSSDNFPRVKIGVGKKPRPEYDLVKWVLGEMSGEQLEELTKALCLIPDICSLIISGKISEAMGKYNGKRSVGDK